MSIATIIANAYGPSVKGGAMRELNVEKVCEILNRVLEYELAGVVRYTLSLIHI